MAKQLVVSNASKMVGITQGTNVQGSIVEQMTFFLQKTIKIEFLQ